MKWYWYWSSCRHMTLLMTLQGVITHHPPICHVIVTIALYRVLSTIVTVVTIHCNQVPSLIKPYSVNANCFLYKFKHPACISGCISRGCLPLLYRHPASKIQNIFWACFDDHSGHKNWMTNTINNLLSMHRQCARAWWHIKVCLRLAVGSNLTARALCSPGKV